MADPEESFEYDLASSRHLLERLATKHLAAGDLTLAAALAHAAAAHQSALMLTGIRADLEDIRGLLEEWVRRD